MIVADTNVVSEFMRAAPDPSVVTWASGFAADAVMISAVTVQEIEHGILRLPDGRRRDDLDASWSDLLDRFASLVVSYDQRAAHAAAAVLAEAGASGRGMSLTGAQIAGTCLAHDLTLATRNVKDFAAARGLRVVNPFG